MRASVKAALLSAAFLFTGSACVQSGKAGGARERGEEWARVYGFYPVELKHGDFRLLTLTRQTGAPTTLAVYIEGDGASWPSPFHPPPDPTPLKPVVMGMAAVDPASVVAYFGRPCQYLDRTALAVCASAYWIDRRFAPEVVAVYDEAISRLKERSGARRIRLIGYSGGGVIATLLAMRRDDVDLLVTVAAPLALNDWTTGHGLPPLAGSLDPISQYAGVDLAAGVHFAGSDDKTVPAEIAQRFVALHGGRFSVVDGFDHECCWTRDWQQLLSFAMGKEMAR